MQATNVPVNNVSMKLFNIPVQIKKDIKDIITNIPLISAIKLTDFLYPDFTETLSFYL